MKKLKKTLAALLCVMAVCLFAFSAYADATSDVYSYLGSKGITLTGTMTSAQKKALADKRDYLTKMGDYLFSNSFSSMDLAKANVQESVNIISGLGAFPGMSASVTPSGNVLYVVITAPGANGTTLTAQRTLVVSSTASTTANAITGSSSSVIKATGDGGSFMLAVLCLGIAATLCLGVYRSKRFVCMADAA